MTAANINVSDSALKQIASLIAIEGNPDLMLRVYITGGGCAGFQYGFAFEKEKRPDDYICEQNVRINEQDLSVKVAVDPMSMMYLMGATVDYIENLRGRHFTVKNPNASTTCSCGSSFGIGGDED